MRTARPFRFGAVFTRSYDAKQWSETARRLEAAGFATLLVADHYGNPMACGPLLLAAASATTTLRVGSYVYDNDFRHPALLAKEVATIDVLSDGRMELGLGAGYVKAEYDAVGLPFDPPGVRMRRMEEAVAIIMRLLRGETVEYDGEHYHIHGHTGLPLPVQQPIPLLIGGGGPKMLGYAARVADIVGFVPRAAPGGGLDRGDFTAESLDAKVALLDAALATAGRADRVPERSVIALGIYSSFEELDGDQSYSARSLRSLPHDVVAASPYALVGDMSAMVEALHARRERWGLSYFVCYGHEIDKFIPVVRKLAS